MDIEDLEVRKRTKNNQQKNQKDKAEESVSKFYNSVGWQTEEGVTEDAKRFEDLRAHSQDYAKKTRNLLLEYIPKSGEYILDMASGPIQYEEYLTYSKNFEKRWCVDLSSDALKMAENKIGKHGVFLHGSFFHLPFDENFFDCAISLHTIYHMAKEKQEEAVRKLIRITKPGQPILIIYSNPNEFWKSSFFQKLGIRNRGRKAPLETDANQKPESLYFNPHPLSWWNRFTDEAAMKMVPWRSFGPVAMKKLFPDNWLGKKMLVVLYQLERTFPKFFVKHFTYPLIILTKHIASKG